MAQRKIRFRKNFNIGRVVAKIAITVLVLYVGGTILNNIGTVLNQTCSPFYQGLTLIGWTVGTCTNTAPYNATGGCWANNAGCRSVATTVLDPTGSGILAVVGIIGIASVVMEFVEFRMG